MKGSADFRADTWVRVVNRVVADIHEVSPETAERLLTVAKVHRPKTLNAVDRYLRAHPDGVAHPDADCPRGVMRLTHVLIAAGYTTVHPPQCTQCGGRNPLTSIGVSGRICDRCRLANRPFTCSQCRKPSTHRVNLPEGPVCSNCYSRDPRSKAVCSACGRLGQRRHRLADGGVLCPACAPRPQHTCCGCGRTRPAQALTADGPLCNGCYGRIKMSWHCGLCDEPRRRQSGTGLGPHLCGICRRRLRNGGDTRTERSWVCGLCGTGRRYRSGAGLGPHLCGVCRRGIQTGPHTDSTLIICVFCHRSRPVGNHWPAGRVCKPCAARARTYPAPCASCCLSAVLIGLADDGRRICGPCAGAKIDYRCRNCGQPGVHAKGRCSRCVTADLLDRNLRGPDGRVPEQLLPLRDALGAATDPRSVAVWLSGSAAADLLRAQARGGEPITHEALDALPPGRHVNYVREILVRTAILAPRNEHLEGIEPWLDRHLAGQPAEHARTVRNYALWYLLHRARRGRRPFGKAGAARIRRRVRVALEFLAWLDARGRHFPSFDQGDVDSWLATGNWRHREIRPFLRWTTQRRLTTGVAAPAEKPSPPSVFIDETAHLDQLNRCLHDDGIDVDLRAAGALILLYGIPTMKVLGLRRNQLQIRGNDTFLVLRDHELLLPKQLADLMAQLPRSTRRATLPETDSADRLLFPGRTPDRPVDAGGFGKRLKRSGLTIRGGRNTALLGLAAELPAAVVSDLLAIDIVTATRWATYARTDWNDFVASRAADETAAR